MGADNWLKVCELTVKPEQKGVFPISNVYWIGFSRYEEHTDLYAIKADAEYVGLIGGEYDEDCVSGFINPLIIDKRYQQCGYAREALAKMLRLLKNTLG